MTRPGRTAVLRERRLVLHPLGIGAQWNEKQVDLTQPRMVQPVRALREQAVRTPAEHQGELLADLPLRTRSSRLVTLGRRDEVQGEGSALGYVDVEALSDDVDEVVARQPLEFCHLVMVPAPAQTSRTHA